MTEQTPTNTDRIFEATLRTQLAIAPGLGDVHATVNNGVATLTGNVREEMDIKRAVLISKAVEGLSEVREQIQVASASQGERDGHFEPVEGISSSIPTTIEAAVDTSPINEGLNPTTEADKDSLASLIREGMDVFDSEGKKVGKVKEVRESDFLLRRLLARNYYVPYIACVMSTDGVHLNVKGSEMKDQDWASPHQETP
ncbi:MAG: BON domain-containing protein [Anaerolineaceae bacterium]|jgi:hypothetical protein